MSWRSVCFWGGLLTLAGSSLLACDDSSESADEGNGVIPDDGSSGSGGNSSVPGPGELPPELELEESFRAPVVTGSHLWSANPESNRVALINAKNSSIRTFDAGHAPTFLSALPEGVTSGGALVLNTKSADASLFFLSSSGSGEPEVTSRRIDVQPGASAWAVGETGRFAIAWSKVEVGATPVKDGHQDITVLSFTEDGKVSATRLSVGFQPSRVVINEAETRAFVVSTSGLSVIALDAPSGPRSLQDLFLPETQPGLARDVSLTQDGRHAFVRLEGKSDVLIVDTETDERKTISLSRPVTDLDLSADGSFAIAVLRGDSSALSSQGQGGAGSGAESQVVLLPIPEILSDPGTAEILEVDDIVGSASLSVDGRVAVLYSNAVTHTRLWVLELEGRRLRPVDVKAPVRAALLSKEGENAVVILSPPTGSVKAGAFALVPLRASKPARIEGTDATPVFVSITDGGQAALVTTVGVSGAPSASYLARFPGFGIERIDLPSVPLATGIVEEAGKAFVSQEHPEGRVSFVDWVSSQVTTITGFELGSKVVDR